jgi:two-component system, NtrC family, sensor histidine kinase KinB
MRLRTRLLLGFGAVLATSVIGLGLSLGSARDMSEASRWMVEHNFANVDLASNLRRAVVSQQRSIVDRLSVPGASAVPLLAELEREIGELLEQLRRPRQSVLEQEQLQRAESALRRLRSAVEQADRRPPGELGVPPAVRQELMILRDAALQLYRLHHEAMVRHGRSISTQAQRLSLALGLLAGFTVLIGVVASMHLAQRLSEPMERLANAVQRVSQQDFEVRVAASGVQEVDTVAQRFNGMTAALRRFHAINLDRLLDERRRLDAVIANIDDGLVLFDELGRIERVNPVAAAQLGLDADAVLWRTLDQLQLFPGLAAAVRLLLRDPDAHPDGAAELSVGAGSARRTLTCSLLPFSESQRPGLILVLRDVTDARRFEQLRTQFVLRASHELRTPITSMRMALGLLQAKPPFAEGTREAELFTTLGDETQRLMQLNERLLDLSRLYSGSQPLERAPLDPAEMLRRVHSRFQLPAQQAEIELTLASDADLPEINADGASLERVLDNLVSNALRHTPAGGRVEVTARRHRHELELCVSDTGEGIAPTDQARVFEPFVQIGRKAGGSGLGLAISREIVQQHGGRIRLQSSPGSGSIFIVHLPLG